MNIPHPRAACFQGKASLSVFFLLAANGVPLIGVFYWGWKIGDVMLLFWCENVIIGVMNLLRIILWGCIRHMLLVAIPKAVFFTVHYGMFTFVHGVFVTLFFLPEARMESGIGIPIGNWLHSEGIPIAIIGLVASHFLSLIFNYLGRGEVLRITPVQLMMSPYGRIVILHVTILIGGFFVMMAGNPTLPLVLLILLKTAIDLWAHVREHAKLRKDTSEKQASYQP